MVYFNEGERNKESVVNSLIVYHYRRNGVEIIFLVAVHR